MLTIEEEREEKRQYKGGHMCGICGYTNEKSCSSEVLREMMEKLKHRGPDGEGIYQKGKTALGFRRLGIIDLKNGEQPMYNEDKTLVAVFNGEIYNYQELAEELRQRGHEFQNHSDTECLLHAYEEYGKEMVKHLRGMFAFTIWDEKTELLFAARDPFGIKPFYYFRKPDGGLVFASEIKSLLVHPDCPKKVNEKALDYYLSFQYSVLEETFFQGIFKLLPGHRLVWQSDGKQSTTECYEKIRLQPGQCSSGKEMQQERSRKGACKETRHPKKANDSKTVSDIHKKELETALQDSIQMHLRSDVEVGALLSSGVDSNYINVNSGVRQTFSVGFEEADGRYSELAEIRREQEQRSRENPERKLVNRQKIISAGEFWKVLPEVVYYMDEPLADASAVALYFVDQMAAEHLKVVLSGEGADELFGGYPIYGEPQALAWFERVSMRTRRKWKQRIGKIPFSFKGKNYILRGCTPLEHRFIGNAKIFLPEEKMKLRKNGTCADPVDVTGVFYRENQSLDAVSRMQEIDLNCWLPGDILLKADKMSMAHSLECRVPYLDKAVYRAARTLTQAEKIKGNRTKVMFRSIAGQTVPSHTAQKAKLGFPVPIRIWLRRPEYYNKVLRLFQSPAAEQYFQVRELERLLMEHRDGIQDNSRKIWTIYIFLVWYEVYFDTKTSVVIPAPRVGACTGSRGKTKFPHYV